MKCQHKPNPFEAIEWTGTNAKTLGKCVLPEDTERDGSSVTVTAGKSLRIVGVHGQLALGDWLAESPRGEHRIITAADFEANFEAAPD